MAEGRHRRYLVVQLPRMKLNLWQQLSSTYDGVLLSKMSVSDGLVGNIVLPTRLFPTAVDGFLPSAILIYDGFLCCCNELWPSLIAIFFVVWLSFFICLISLFSFVSGSSTSSFIELESKKLEFNVNKLFHLSGPKVWVCHWTQASHTRDAN